MKTFCEILRELREDRDLKQADVLTPDSKKRQSVRDYIELQKNVNRNA